MFTHSKVFVSLLVSRRQRKKVFLPQKIDLIEVFLLTVHLNLFKKGFRYPAGKQDLPLPAQQISFSF